MSVSIVAAANRVYQEFRTDFLKATNEAPTAWRDYAMEVPSSSRSTLHAWIGNQATVREWLGPRVAKNMATRSWEVINRKWELSYEFERDQIDDDLSGLLAAAIMEARSAGAKWARHEDKLCAETLEAGTSSLCWDGQYYFDTDHPTDVDGITTGTYSNSLSLALTHANARTALKNFLRFKNEDGSPMVAPGGFLCMVPPELDMEAQQIFMIDQLTPAAAYGLFGTSGVSKNPLVGRARVVVNQYLTDTTRWYLLATGDVIKPIMLQRRRPLEQAEEGPGSPLFFEQEKIRIGTSARYAASYTLPQLAMTSKP